ncbi:hypothetical protein Dimus_032144 [Dionaea muscipula]
MVSQERACDAHAREEQDRQKIASLRLKNKRLKRKFKKLKTDDNEYHKVSMSSINQMAEELSNIKADMDMLTQDNVSLEKLNGELTKRNADFTCDLKSTSNECDVLKRWLKDMEEENERLRVEMRTERDEANIKSHQIVERADVLQKTVEEIENKRRILENHLRHQLQFLKRKTIREFVGSGDLIKMVSSLMLHRIYDGYLMAVAECRHTLERAGNLNHMEYNPDVDYEPEPPHLQ